MPVTGDFDKLRSLRVAFVGMSRDATSVTQFALDETRKTSEKAFDQEADPTGRPWAELKPSTLKRRPPGKKLAGLRPARIWRILGRGRWEVRDDRKPHDGFHTTGTRNMEARPDLPVMPGGMLVYGEAVGRAVLRWIQSHLLKVGG